MFPVDSDSTIVVVLVCNSSIDTNVLARDPSGFLVDQEKYGIANISGGSGAVVGSSQGYLGGHELFLMSLWVYIGQYRTRSHRVDGEALAPAEL
jgi:hypothetical protein